MTSAAPSDLINLALSALGQEYDSANEELFGNLLNKPPLRAQDSVRELGAYCAEPREIRVSQSMLIERAWPFVVEVLRHEMAHQFVVEVLRLEEPAHGVAFVGVCQERGIDPRATASVDATERQPTTGVLGKVMRLLSLAQSENANEAEAAMAAAQRLMLKHNLSQEALRERSHYVVRHLGVPSGRVPEHERIVGAILAEFFFVEVLWLAVWRVREARQGSLLEICGSEENVELAEYVYHFLERSAESLWRSHRLSHGIRGNRDRRRFYAGVMNGFYKKLRGQQAEVQREGLVWRGDPKLQAFFSARHPRTQLISYGRRTLDETYLAGRQAGSELVLHRGLAGRTRSEGRLLPR